MVLWGASPAGGWAQPDDDKTGKYHYQFWRTDYNGILKLAAHGFEGEFTGKTGTATINIYDIDNAKVICGITITVENRHEGFAIKSDSFWYNADIQKETGADALVYSQNGVAEITSYGICVTVDGKTEKMRIGAVANKAVWTDENSRKVYYDPLILYVDGNRISSDTFKLSNGLHELRLVFGEGAYDITTDEIKVYVDNQVNMTFIENGMDKIETGDDNVDKLIDFILNDSIGACANDMLIDMEKNRVLKEIAGYLYDLATDTVVRDFESIVNHITDDALQKYKEEGADKLLASLSAIYTEAEMNKALDNMAQFLKYDKDALKYTFKVPEVIIKAGEGKAPWESLPDGRQKDFFKVLYLITGGLKLGASTLERISDLNEEQLVTCTLIASSYDDTKAYLVDGAALARANGEDVLADIYDQALSKLDGYYESVVNSYIDNADEFVGWLIWDVGGYAADLTDKAPKLPESKDINYLKFIHSATKLVMGEWAGGNSMYDNQEAILEDLLVVSAFEKDVELAAQAYIDNEASTEDIIKRVIALGNYKKQMLEHLSAYEDARWFTAYKESIDGDAASLDATVKELIEYLNQ